MTSSWCLGGDLEGHVGGRLLAGAFDGGDFEAEVDDVVGLVGDELFEADEEALVAELAGDLEAGAGGDVLDGASCAASRALSASSRSCLRAASFLTVRKICRSRSSFHTASMGGKVMAPVGQMLAQVEQPTAQFIGSTATATPSSIS